MRTILLAALLSYTAPAAVDKYQEKLEPMILNLMAQQEAPGLAIGVVENNQVVYAKGFGVRRIGTATPEPVTTRTLFHMASITKTFVATSIMQLVEAGKIDLDAPVVKYLPYFRLADDRYKTITVRQMVTHTSGMPDVEDYEWDKPQYYDGALERYARSLGAVKLLWAPGEKFRYSNMAFEVLGDVIAKVSGESFDDYVQNHILTPLAMKDSTLLIKKADPALLAWGHELDEKGDAFPSRVYPYNRMHSPSSNLHSNVNDMVRWAVANMNRGELDGKRILPAPAYDLMWKPVPGRPVGISWFLNEYRNMPRVSHGGSDEGFLTNIALIPEKQLAVVAMTNCQWISVGALTTAALDVASGVEPKPFDQKRSAADVVTTVYRAHGVEAVIEAYKSLKKTKPGAYDFSEKQLNDFGQYLLRKAHPKDAARVFQLNLDLFPSSTTAQEGLREALKN
jgi:CubicO group peptidase (beta-lactamase class C family)